MATNKNSEQAEPNTLKDQWGNEHSWDGERYPEDSAAREGNITKPSGQGGATPKARPDHQDMFPRNAQPDSATLEYGERLARKQQGEDVDLTEPLTPVDKNKSTKTTTKPSASARSEEKK